MRAMLERWSGRKIHRAVSGIGRSGVTGQVLSTYVLVFPF